MVFGLDLMSNNIKSRMLITGVAKGVFYSEIIKNKNLKKNRIELGYLPKHTWKCIEAIYGLKNIILMI